MFKWLLLIFISININAYDPNKKVIYLPGMIFYDFDNSANGFFGINGNTGATNAPTPAPPKFNKDTLKLVKKLMEAEDFNIVIDDTNMFGSSISLDQDLKENIFDKLPSDHQVIQFKKADPQVQLGLQSKMGNGDVIFANKMPGDKNEDIFFNLYQGIKNDFRLGIGGSTSWLNFNSPEKDSDLARLIFELGGVTLNEGYDLKKLGFKIKKHNGVTICEKTYKGSPFTFSLDVCLEHFIESEKKWGEGGRCGLYEKETSNLLKNLPRIECEPERVQAFLNYLKNEFVSTCDDAFSCQNTVGGESVKNLSQSLEKILVFNRIREIESKTRKEESFDYQFEVDRLIDKLADYNQACQTEKSSLDIVLSKEDQKDVDDFISEVNVAFDSYANFEEGLKKDLKEKTLFTFKNCLRKNQEKLQGRLEDNKESPRNEILDGCKKKSFNYTIEELIKDYAGKKGDQYSNVKSFLQGKADIFCHYDVHEATEETNPNLAMFNPISGGMEVPITGDDSLSFPYDLKRCSRFLERQNQIYKSLQSRDNIDLSSFSKELKIEIHSNRQNGLLEQSFKKCEGLTNEKELIECKDKALNEAKAEILLEDYFKLTKETGVARFPNQGELLIQKAKSNKVLNQCLNESAPVKKEDCFKEIEREFSYSLLNPYSVYEDAGSALTSDLAKLTKTLSRDISVFHWGSDELTGNNKDEPVPLKSFNGYKYALAREYMFHTGPILDSLVEVAGATLAGRGLYAASDPNSTRSYGPTLVEIEIPKGSKILDLREGGTHGKIPISLDTYNKLKAEGCNLDELKEEADAKAKASMQGTAQANTPEDSELSRFNDFAPAPPGSPYYLFVGKGVFEQNRACHNALQTAVKRLDLNVLAYNYGHQLPTFCDQENMNRNASAAFVMIDNKMRGNVTTYNAASIEKALKDHREKGIPIPEKIRRLLQVHDHQSETKDDLFPSAYNPFRADGSLESREYWKSRIFNCDHSIEEDAVDSGIIPSSSQMFQF